MTMGVYHQYTTNKIMELNNEKLNLEHKHFLDKIEREYRKEMDELIKRCNKLEQSRKWF
jgi:hypothetical protein